MKTEKEIETKAVIPSYLFSLPTGNERLRFRDSIIKLDFIILGNFCRGGNELIVFLFFFFFSNSFVDSHLNLIIFIFREFPK